MVPFKIAPQIATCKDFRDFAASFQLDASDLVITNEFLYTDHMAILNLKCSFLFQERFGSGEPSNVMMDEIWRVARTKEFDRVIAVGGGTVIDIAKLLVLGGTGKTVDYFERRIPLQKEKALIIVPTTCGTGSEVTNITIMEIKEQHTKKGLADDVLYADSAVLIPDLLATLPYQVFATSSVDALVHAVESYISPKATEFTKLFSAKAIELILTGYKQVSDTNKAPSGKLMKDFLIASNYAGIAFANAGVGAVHAMAYPLGATYHVPHGEANQLMFIAVFKEYKKLAPQGKIVELEDQLARLLGVELECVWAELEALLEKIIPRKSLREYGMKEGEIEGFSDSVLANQQRLLANNYIALDRKNLIAIYTQLY